MPRSSSDYFSPARLTQLTAPPYSPASVSHLHQMSQVSVSYYKSFTKNDNRIVVMVDDKRTMMSQVFWLFYNIFQKTGSLNHVLITLE